MKPSIPSSAVNRRALLSTLAVLPALATSAQAETAPPGGALPSCNDKAAKQAILDFVNDTTDHASPKFGHTVEHST